MPYRFVQGCACPGKPRPPKSVNPVAIALPQEQAIPNGTVVVSLATMADLETFWKKHGDQLPYACEGSNTGEDPIFLREYDWVFGPTRASVIKTELSLGQSTISIGFYN